MVVLELQLAQHVVLVLVGRVHGRGARVLLGAKAVDHRRVQKARDVRRHDPGEHLLCRGLKADGLFCRLLFGKVLILQRQQAHGAHVHVHAVAKVGVDDKELGDLAPVEEIQKLRRDLSRAAERGALRIVAEAVFHRHAVAGEEVPPVAAHHKKAAVGVLFKALHRLLNNILVVGARKAAVRRHHKIGVCSRLGQIVRVAPVEVRALDLARVLEDLLDLRQDRVEKRARLGKVFFRPPHLGRSDEVHRVRHLLRALDARDVLADLLHARHVPVTSLFIWKNSFAQIPLRSR